MTKFRARKVDARRSLPLFKTERLRDLDETGHGMQRMVHTIETGVEKEEEAEHHLQAVMSAREAIAAGHKVTAPLYIPTPETAEVTADATQLYYAPFKQPKEYIRFSATVEETTGCPYTMDETDLAWLDAWNRGHTEDNRIDENRFEETMWYFEQYVDRQSVANPAELAFPSLESNMRETRGSLVAVTTKDIFAHWQARRTTLRGRYIMPRLMTEDGWKDDNDPYVCFRRRDLKPIRKTRRSNQTCFERLKRLSEELRRAVEVADMVDRRERTRRESLLMEQRIHDQTMRLRDARRQFGFKDESEGLFTVVKKAKKEKDISAVTKSLMTRKADAAGFVGDERSFMDAQALQRWIELEIQKRKVEDLDHEDITEHTYFPFPRSAAEAAFKAMSSVFRDDARNGSQVEVHVRLRTGRGRRQYMDRRQARPSTALKRSYDLMLSGTSDLAAQIPERYRYDQDYLAEMGALPNQHEFTDEWRPDVLRKRCKLMTDVDLKELLFKPRQPILPPEPPVPIVNWIYPTPSVPSSIPAGMMQHGMGGGGGGGHHSSRPPPAAVTTNYHMAVVAQQQQQQQQLQASGAAAGTAIGRGRGATLSYGRGGTVGAGRGANATTGRSSRLSSTAGHQANGTASSSVSNGHHGSSNALMLTPSNMVGAAQSASAALGMNGPSASAASAYQLANNRIMTKVNGVAARMRTGGQSAMASTAPNGPLAVANGIPGAVVSAATNGPVGVSNGIPGAIANGTIIPPAAQQIMAALAAIKSSKVASHPPV